MPMTSSVCATTLFSGALEAPTTILRSPFLGEDVVNSAKLSLVKARVATSGSRLSKKKLHATAQSASDYPFQQKRGATGFFTFPVITREPFVRVPNPDLPDDSLALQWNRLLLQVVRDSFSTGDPSLPGPPIVARAFGIVNACMFDAWAVYTEKAVGIAWPSESLRASRAEFLNENKRIAISVAAAKAITTLFPSSTKRVDDFLRTIPLSDRSSTLKQPAMTGAPKGLQTIPIFQVANIEDLVFVALDGGGLAGVSNSPQSPLFQFRYDANAPLSSRPIPAPGKGGRSSPIITGILAATRVLERFAQDGSNFPTYADTTGYRPFNPNNTNRIADVSRWTPTSYFVPLAGRVNQDNFLVPHWGLANKIAFALSRPDEFRPPPPWDVNNNPKEFNAQIDEILSSSRTIGEGKDEGDRLRAVAEYWADGPNNETAPGIHILQATFISRRDKHDLDKDIKFFTMLGGTLQDCAIAAWDAKRAYDNARMITPIRILRAKQEISTWGGPGLGLVKVLAAKWLPYLVNPPFPDHISGHATFAGGAGTLFQTFTGNDNYGDSVVIKAGTSAVEPGFPRKDVTLTWKTHTEAQMENGISRLYGGIHWAKANTDGQDTGAKVAQKVFTFVTKTLLKE